MQNQPASKTGFYRLPNIIGNPKANPPVDALIPVCAATWWAGVRSGRFPKPFKLSPRVTVWSAQDIHDFIAATVDGDKS